MVITPPLRLDPTPHAGRNRENLPFLLALIAAGVAGNYFHFQLFFNIDFLFGSIFALLALQRFGWGRGVIASALISAYTIILWNHPYACIILISEVAVVGWLLPRRRIGLVLADTLYWVFLGMPLVYFFYHGIMEVSWENTSIVMIKQAMNGIANALVARLLFAGYTLRSRDQLLPFREVISSLLLFFLLCPTLTLLADNSREIFSHNDQHTRDTLLHDRIIVSDSLKYWLEQRKDALVTLANLTEHLTPRQMQSRLEQARTADPEFLRIGLFDPTATSIAYTPLVDDLGRSTIGKNFADRPYVALLKKSLRPLLTEVVMARIGTPKPTAHMLVPVLKDSKYAGYIVGVFNLDHLETLLTMNAKRDGQHFILLDRHGKTIVTNDPEQKVLTSLVRGAGRLSPVSEGISQWIPTLPANTPTMERWKKSYYVTEANIGDLSEWRLVLEQPIAPFQKELYDTYSRKLTVLFCVLLGALLLAEILSRLITRSNEKLLAMTSDLPTKLSGGYPMTWPESAIAETKQLIENFRLMTATLAEQFNAIRKLNLSLEERVAVRTRELSESRERYDLALLGSQDGIWDWNVQDNEVFFSARWFEILGYTADELESTFATFEDLVHPDDLENIREQVRRHHQERIPYSVEFRMRRKDGEYSWILARGQALWNEEGQAVRMAGSHTDISERKKAEEQILSSLREKEVLLKEIHHRVKNNLQIVYSLLALQSNSIADSDIRALFDESRNRIGSMSLIHEKIYKSRDLAHIDFNQYLLELTQNIARTYLRPNVSLNVERTPIYLDITAGIPCGLIVNELVSNSFKYAFPAGETGQISLGLTRTMDGHGFLLTVADNGVGLPRDIDFRHTTSLGLQLVTVLAGQLQGEISLATTGGTGFTIRFPAQTS